MLDAESKLQPMCLESDNVQMHLREIDNIEMCKKARIKAQ